MREETSASASLGLTVLTLEFKKKKKKTFTLFPAVSPEESLVHSECSVKIVNKNDSRL